MGRDPAQIRSVADEGKWLLFACIALVCSLLCLVGMSMRGRQGLVQSSLGTLGVAYLVAMAGRRALPQSITWVVLMSIYGSQIAMQVVIGALDIPSLGGNGFDIYANIGALTVSQLCLLGGSLLAAMALSAFSHDRRDSVSLLRIRLSLRMRVYLFIAVVLALSRTILPFVLPGIPQYIFLVLSENLNGACFFVGWFHEDMGKLRPWCLALMAGNIIVCGLIGSRFGMLLLGIYVVGRLISPREQNRRRVALFSALMLAPALLVSSAIAEVRSIVGRGSLDLINMSTLTMMANATIHADSAGASGSLNGAYLLALSRFYAWPNAAVAEITPEEVPYRGYQEWLSEWKSYINPNMGGNSEEYQDMFYQEGIGGYHGSDYGFTNEPGNNTEFGTLADGWSTGGPLGVVLLAFLVALVICGAELAVTHTGISSAGVLLLTCVLSSVGLLAYTNPVPITLKAVLASGAMWLIIIKCLDAAADHRFGDHERCRVRSSN